METVVVPRLPEPELTAARLQHLPIFPLPDTVLIPRGYLPLHVFEPRYRKLVTDCLADDRVLAVPLLAHAVEEAQPGTQPRQIKVHRVVGLGYIEAVQSLKDGRSNIVLRGTTRVRILEELVTDEPYRVVRAEPIEDLPAAVEELALSAAILRRLAAQLLLRLPRELGEAISRAMAEVKDPGGLADLVGASVLIDPRQRQTFLEERNVQRRLSLSTHLVAGLLAELGSADDSQLAN